MTTNYDAIHDNIANPPAKQVGQLYHVNLITPESFNTYTVGQNREYTIFYNGDDFGDALFTPEYLVEGNDWVALKNDVGDDIAISYPICHLIKPLGTATKLRVTYTGTPLEVTVIIK